MHRFFTPLLRRVYLGFGLFALVYISLAGFQGSAWNKERLYRKLVDGNPEIKLAAAAELVYLQGVDQLVRALRAKSPEVRQMATHSLWEVWIHQAGEEPYRRTRVAAEAARRQEFAEALGLLTRLVEDYPGFAEGWNRRATLYWEMGHYDEAIADCKKVLALNPNHFGAWHGMGLCQLQVGDIFGAWQSFRAAVRIHPFDSGFRHSLQHCEELLEHLRPQPRVQAEKA